MSVPPINDHIALYPCPADKLHLHGQEWERGGKFLALPSGRDLTGRTFHGGFMDTSRPRAGLVVHSDEIAPATRAHGLKVSARRQDNRRGEWHWTHLEPESSHLRGHIGDDDNPANQFSHLVLIEQGGHKHYAVRLDFAHGHPVTLERRDEPLRSRNRKTGEVRYVMAPHPNSEVGGLIEASRPDSLRVTTHGRLLFDKIIGKVRAANGMEHPVYAEIHVVPKAVTKGVILTRTKKQADYIAKSIEENPELLRRWRMEKSIWRKREGTTVRTMGAPTYKEPLDAMTEAFSRDWVDRRDSMPNAKEEAESKRAVSGKEQQFETNYGNVFRDIVQSELMRQNWAGGQPSDFPLHSFNPYRPQEEMPFKETTPNPSLVMNEQGSGTTPPSTRHAVRLDAAKMSTVPQEALLEALARRLEAAGFDFHWAHETGGKAEKNPYYEQERQRHEQFPGHFPAPGSYRNLPTDSRGAPMYPDYVKYPQMVARFTSPEGEAHEIEMHDSRLPMTDVEIVRDMRRAHSRHDAMHPHAKATGGSDSALYKLLSPNARAHVDELKSARKYENMTREEALLKFAEEEKEARNQALDEAERALDRTSEEYDPAKGRRLIEQAQQNHIVSILLRRGATPSGGGGNAPAPSANTPPSAPSGSPPQGGMPPSPPSGTPPPPPPTQGMGLPPEIAHLPAKWASAKTVQEINTAIEQVEALQQQSQTPNVFDAVLANLKSRKNGAEEAAGQTAINFDEEEPPSTGSAPPNPPPSPPSGGTPPPPSVIADVANEHFNAAAAALAQKKEEEERERRDAVGALENRVRGVLSRVSNRIIKNNLDLATRAVGSVLNPEASEEEIKKVAGKLNAVAQAVAKMPDGSDVPPHSNMTPEMVNLLNIHLKSQGVQIKKEGGYWVVENKNAPAPEGTPVAPQEEPAPPPAENIAAVIKEKARRAARKKASAETEETPAGETPPPTPPPPPSPQGALSFDEEPQAPAKKRGRPKKSE